jgi:16S rRNA (uracil1498-N3)-methyltransferase
MTEPAVPASRADSAAHVFVDDVDVPVVSADDRHHLERVLRLRAGELVTVSDGRGRWRWVRLGAAFEPVSDVLVEPAPSPPLTVAFAVLKGDRNELVVQKLTELGIDRIVPLVTERCVVRWDDARGGRQRERWVRVAREAAMQSRRVWLPAVDAPTEFGSFVGDHVALCSADGGPLAARHTVLLVGPEGGWSDTEHASAASRVRLGPNVLRAETAAITAGAFAAAIRSSLVMPYAT